MAEAVNSPADVEREPDVGPVPDEQPTAPYLEAVVAYAFRGPARYHVPGPQGRAGRRPGRAQGDRRRRAGGRRAAGHPRDRPRAVADAVRARRAARRRGVRRRALVVPHERRDPGQPRALPRARAARARGSSPSATRTRRSSTASSSAAGSRASSRPSTTRSSASRTASRRTRSRPRCARRRTRAPRSSSRRPTTAWRPTSPGSPRSPTRAGVPLVVDQSWGPHFGFHEHAAADRALAGRRRDAHEHAQDRRLADAERDAARRRTARPRRRRRGRPRAAAAALDQPVVAAARLARRRPPPARAARRAAAARDARGDRGRAREARDDPRHRARRRVGSSGGWASRATTRCGSSLDVRGTGRTGYEIADALRRSYDVHLELPMQATVVFVVGLGESATDAAAAGGRHRRDRQAASREPGATPRRSCRRPPRCATRSPSRRARRSSARPSRSRSTTPSAGSRASRSPATRRACRRCCRASASRPRPSPTCASSRQGGARLHGASDPGSRPSTCSGRSDDRSRWSAGRSTARSPTTPGLLTFGGAAVHRRTPPSCAGFDVADRRRADGRPRLRPPGRAARAARDPRARAARPGRTSRRSVDAFAALRVVDFGDAPVIPADPVRVARRRSRRRRPGARRRRAPGRARRRPLDHRAVRARVRGRPRAGRDDPLRHPHGHRRRGLRRRALARHVHPPPRRRGHDRCDALRPDRPARLLAGRGRVRLAGRARDHEPVRARRARPRHPRGRPARDRGGRPGPGLPDRRRRRARPGVHRRGTGTPGARRA